MIEALGLSKRYGDKLAVNNVSFTVQAGCITGFLGPNGAGKSTTIRLLLGLDRQDAGTARIAGKPYSALDRPMRVVGALLDAKATHPGRSCRAHLRWLAQTQRIPAARVDAVLEQVGLQSVADKHTGGLSLGMAQRLGIAAAMLGDPPVLLLDEPVNGLDPAGVRWIRGLMKQWAAEGRAVLVSSHLMNEMAVTADKLLVLARGRLLADCSLAEFVASSSQSSVRVRSSEQARFAQMLENLGGEVRRDEDALIVSGLETSDIAAAASKADVLLRELTPVTSSLEEAFMELTEAGLEYRGSVSSSTSGMES